MRAEWVWDKPGFPLADGICEVREICAVSPGIVELGGGTGPPWGVTCGSPWTFPGDMYVLMRADGHGDLELHVHTTLAGAQAASTATLIASYVPDLTENYADEPWDFSPLVDKTNPPDLTGYHIQTTPLPLQTTQTWSVWRIPGAGSLAMDAGDAVKGMLDEHIDQGKA